MSCGGQAPEEPLGLSSRDYAVEGAAWPCKAPCGEGTSPRGGAWLRNVFVEDHIHRCPRLPRRRRLVGLRSAVHRPADTLRPSGPPLPYLRRDTHRPAVRTDRVRRRSAARTAIGDQPWRQGGGQGAFRKDGLAWHVREEHER